MVNHTSELMGRAPMRTTVYYACRNDGCRHYKRRSTMYGPCIVCGWMKRLAEIITGRMI
jgi:hypothetical protein